MNVNELKRVEIVIKVIEKQLTKTEVVDILNVRVRQMKRLVKQFRIYREEGLVSKKRGSPSKHQLQKGLKEVAISLIEEKYPDFSPTLAQEKRPFEP